MIKLQLHTTLKTKYTDITPFSRLNGVELIHLIYIGKQILKAIKTLINYERLCLIDFYISESNQINYLNFLSHRRQTQCEFTLMSHNIEWIGKKSVDFLLGCSQIKIELIEAIE